MYLFECTDSIKKLAGVGPKALESYSALGVNTIGDLIQLIPRAYEDHSTRVCIGNQIPGSMTNTIVCIESVSSFGRSLNSVKIKVRDTENSKCAYLLGFNRSYLKKTLYSGLICRLYANIKCEKRTFESSDFTLEVVPDYIAGIEDNACTVNDGILGVYSITGSLNQKAVRRCIRNALSDIKIDDDIPQSVSRSLSLIDLDSALRLIHFPRNESDIKIALRTLSFHESFYMFLETLRRPPVSGVKVGIEKNITNLERTFVNSLPFSLTQDQCTALEEIRADMSKEKSMMRLLQGDVGSGKTLVAWISAIHAIAYGKQVAFMAPTELLARQHAIGAASLIEKTGISIGYLDGNVKGRARAELLKQLREGNVDLLIGTHALFSKDVEFRNLGYVIIDEQHRFGVQQRTMLTEKGIDVHVLLMTATPIPRTLALTVFGNLGISSIHTKPTGRLPVITYLVSPEKRYSMYKSIAVELERGHKAYFVYPRIENTEGSELRDVQSMYKYLSECQYPSFSGAVIHSKIPDDDKVKILEDFRTGKIQYLCATSVVEVGIDVPDATCIVVEHADVFGLSALHQLRGRVGRSSLQSWCFLAFEDNITDDGKKRLGVLRRSCDGFEISEEDLKIRGPGELSGMKQSGFINLKFTNLEKDLDLMADAKRYAAKVLDDDPGLIKIENSAIRQTLGFYSCKT